MAGRTYFRNCPLCQSINIPTLRKDSCAHHPSYDRRLPPIIEWLKCADCSHVFTAGYWTEHALSIIFSKDHPELLPGYDPHGSRAIASRMVEKVYRHVLGISESRSGAEVWRWLDVGIGSGALMGAAEEYGFTVTGLDLRPQAIESLTLDGLDARKEGFMDHQSDAPYDVLSMCDVLEHLPFPVPALQHAHQLMATDGLLLISLPNSDCYTWRLLDRHGVNPYWGEAEHYHNFGKRRLYALLRQTGFEPIKYSISERYYLCMEVIARKVPLITARQG